MEGIAISKICINFAVAIEKGSVAQLNRAFDYGSKGYRFESCRGHKEGLFMAPFLFFQCIFAMFVSKSILYGKK